METPTMETRYCDQCGASYRIRADNPCPVCPECYAGGSPAEQRDWRRGGTTPAEGRMAQVRYHERERW